MTAAATRITLEAPNTEDQFQTWAWSAAVSQLQFVDRNSIPEDHVVPHLLRRAYQHLADSFNTSYSSTMAAVKDQAYAAGLKALADAFDQVSDYDMDVTIRFWPTRP